MPSQSAWQIAGWKTKVNIISTTESELWRNAGPNAFKLQKNMLKSGKIWLEQLLPNYVGLQIFWTTLVYYIYDYYYENRTLQGSSRSNSSSL